MIVLFLWLAGLIIGLAFANGALWKPLFFIEMWVIQKFGKEEEL